MCTSNSDAPALRVCLHLACSGPRTRLRLKQRVLRSKDGNRLWWTQLSSEIISVIHLVCSTLVLFRARIRVGEYFYVEILNKGHRVAIEVVRRPMPVSIMLQIRGFAKESVGNKY